MLFSLAVIFSYGVIYIQFKSFLLSLFMITVGLTLIIGLFAAKNGETPTYFASMFIINSLQWFILICMALIKPSIFFNYSNIILLAIAPSMTVIMVHRFMIVDSKSIEPRKISIIYANFIDEIKKNKAKGIMIYTGILIIFGCIIGVLLFKSAEYLYGILIGLLFIIYGNFREENGINITTTYIVLMCAVIGFQWLFLMLFSLSFSSADYTVLAWTLTMVISANFVMQVAMNDIKNAAERIMTEETNNNGFMACNKCNRYYKIKPGGSPEDFPQRCECGGKLEFKDMVWDQG